MCRFGPNLGMFTLLERLFQRRGNCKPNDLNIQRKLFLSRLANWCIQIHLKALGKSEVLIEITVVKKKP